MFIKVHVYDDGDVEITKLPQPNPGDLSFTDRRLLVQELRDYGHEDDRIQRALKELDEVKDFEPIIL